jgi:TolB-like protein/Flp pilus assembly protein TadD
MTQESANQMTLSSDVFVSYASQDAAVAKAIVDNLEKQGLKCWMAPRDVRPGAPYADAIVLAINEARALVLVLSGNAVASDHVAREIERAASKHKQIIAFRIDATSLSPGLEYFLSNSQWIDVPTLRMPAALAKLVEAVGQGPAIQAQQIPATNRTGRTKRRMAIAAASLVCAGAVAAVGLHLWSTSHRAGQQVAVISDKSIAVLPFVDMSEKKDQAYFADGMAEEILNLLAKIPLLKVIGRTSSFQFKGQDEDLRAIGTKLGVAYVLEGSVRRSSDRVRVTAQLIDTRDGAHLWSETYDRPASDVLQLQGEIATTLARSLEIGIGADSLQSKRRLKNDEVYDLYLRGRYAAERGDADGLAASAAYLRQALDEDPTFADAALALALTYFAQAYNGLASSIIFEQARQTAEYALKLDPGLGLAHAVLGGIHTDYDWDWPAADREFKQALARAPHNGLVLSIAANRLIALGDLDGARQMLKEALAYDPLLADAYATLSWTELCSGRYAGAEAAASRLLEIEPSYDWGHIYVGSALMGRGDFEAAVAEMKRESNPMAQATGLAVAYTALGRKVDSDSALRKLIAEGARNYAYEIAEVYGLRGERDNALKWLDRAYVQKDATLKWIKRDPSFVKLEADPNYKAFLRKMNLPE